MELRTSQFSCTDQERFSQAGGFTTLTNCTDETFFLNFTGSLEGTSLKSCFICILFPADDDYSPQDVTLTFAPGQTTASLDVPIGDDDINELLEFFTAMLRNPSMGAVIGPDSVATVNIVDNDRK